MILSEAVNYIEMLENKENQFLNINNWNTACIVKHPSKTGEFAIELGINNQENNFKTMNTVTSEIEHVLQFKNNDVNDVIIIDIGKIELLNCGDENNKKTSKNKFIEGGISISSAEKIGLAGTLGGVFILEKDPNKYFITNAHVLDMGSPKKEKNSVIHPAFSDGKEEEIKKIGEIIWMERLHNNVDAGIVKLMPDVKIGNYTRCNSIQINGIANVVLGMEVEKCGRTTGLTKSKITGFKCILKIEGRVLKNQIQTNCMGKPGDSGSLLVNLDKKVVGLIFSKSSNNLFTFSTPIKMIFDVANSQNNKIKFKKFINKNDINMKEITVNRTDSKTPYNLITYENNEAIDVLFTKWNNKGNITALEVIKNAKGHKILSIDYVKKDSCNELQIKFIKGKENSFITEITNCDLLNTQVVLIQFLSDKIEVLHNKIQCSKEYKKNKKESDPILIPIISKGNILIGNP